MSKQAQSLPSLASISPNVNYVYVAVFALWNVYLYFNLYAPMASNVFHIHPTVLSLLRLSVSIPYLIIWLAAAYSALTVWRYARTIDPSPEATAFYWMAKGIAILLGSLVVSTLLSSIRSYFAEATDMRPLLTILTNYGYIVPYFIAFVYFARASSRLTLHNQPMPIQASRVALYSIPLMIFIYVLLETIFSNPNRLIAIGPNGATYYLRDSLLVLTVILPSLVTWVLGLITALRITSYYQAVRGIIYRQSLSHLAKGIMAVLVGSIILQGVLSLGTQRILFLGLSQVLVIVYAFLLIQLLGFLMIARGANNLAKIEVV
jgi:hypothetical protein